MIKIFPGNPTKVVLTAFSFNYLFLILAFSSNGQESTFQHSLPITDSFLHISQDHFASGDTIWYKAYLPSIDKKVFSILIVNREGKVFSKQRLKKEALFVASGIVIPLSLKTGSYYLLASTSDYGVTCKKFFVINKESPGLGNESPVRSLSVEFFPEGGAIIEGIAGKVAFKVTGDNGNDKPLEGMLLNQENKEITKIYTTTEGIGLFLFKPNPGESYYALFRLASGKNERFPLPASEKEGYKLIVNHLRETIKVIVQYSGKDNKNKEEKELLLSIQSNGKEYLQVTGSLKEGILIASFEKSKLQPGENNILLRDDLAEIVSARKIFIEDQKSAAVRIIKDKEVYRPGERVKLTLKAEGKDQSPLNLSIGVTNQNAIASAKIPDLYQVLSEPDPSKREKLLDLIMLTNPPIQGNVKGASSSDYITISGIIRDKLTKAPRPNHTIHFLFPAQGEYLQTKSNQLGTFEITLFDFTGKKDCYILPEILKSQGESEIIVDDNLSFFPVDTLFTLSNRLINYANTTKTKSVIDSAFENISAETKVIDEIESRSDYSNFTLTDHTFILADYEDFSTIEETVKEVFFPLRIVRSNGKPRLKVVSKELNIPLEGYPLIIIDGVPTFDPFFFFQIPPKDLLKIEVLNSIQTLSPFGSLGNSGVISVLTTKQSDAILVPQTTKMEVEGLSHVIGYRSSKSFASEIINYRSPVFKSLAYWNPLIELDKTREIQFDLSEEAGVFEVRVQAMTANGVMLFANEEIEVKMVSK